jgi:hypothetical protein
LVPRRNTAIHPVDGLQNLARLRYLLGREHIRYC